MEEIKWTKINNETKATNNNMRKLNITSQKRTFNTVSPCFSWKTKEMIKKSYICKEIKWTKIHYENKATKSWKSCTWRQCALTFSTVATDVTWSINETEKESPIAIIQYAFGFAFEASWGRTRIYFFFRAGLSEFYNINVAGKRCCSVRDSSLT